MQPFTILAVATLAFYLAEAAVASNKACGRRKPTTSSSAASLTAAVTFETFTLSSPRPTSDVTASIGHSLSPFKLVETAKGPRAAKRDLSEATVTSILFSSQTTVTGAGPSDWLSLTSTQRAEQPSTVWLKPSSVAGFNLSSGSAISLPLETYSGPESAFPPQSEWVSFDEMWTLNENACNAPSNDGKGQTIQQDILQVASETGVDPRVILGVILQESSCDINVATTDGGVRNPGLMQSFNGVSYDGTDASILQMIIDGVEGTNQPGGYGIEQYISQFGLYAGLRAYNSGPNGIDTSNLSTLPAGTGTASYCSDIANRLTGAKVES